MSRVPDFFVVGAAKSGTTSLWQYLGQHPQIYMTQDIAAKELGYYCDYYGVRNLDHYISYFRGAKSEHLIGESCHAYLSSPESAALIKAAIPQAKIIMILRNPADRAYSLYNWMVSEGYESMPTFEDALAAEESRAQNPDFKTRNPQGFYMNYLYVASGKYYEQVKKYFDTFGPENCRVFLFEEFKNDASATVKEVFSFLGIGDVPVQTRKVHNESVQVKNVGFQYYLRQRFVQKFRKAGFSVSFLQSVQQKLMKFNTRNKPPEKMKAETKQKLQEFFCEDIANLETLIGRKIDQWKK